jgi:hypothetical protein
VNTSVTDINLYNNRIDADGASALAEALEVNTSVNAPTHMNAVRMRVMVDKVAAILRANETVVMKIQQLGMVFRATHGKLVGVKLSALLKKHPAVFGLSPGLDIKGLDINSLVWLHEHSADPAVIACISEQEAGKAEKVGKKATKAAKKATQAAKKAAKNAAKAEKKAAKTSHALKGKQSKRNTSSVVATTSDALVDIRTYGETIGAASAAVASDSYSGGVSSQRRRVSSSDALLAPLIASLHLDDSRTGGDDDGGGDDDDGNYDVAAADTLLKNMFFRRNATAGAEGAGVALASRSEAASAFSEYALLGRLDAAYIDDDDDDDGRFCGDGGECDGENEVYLNTHEPFCMRTVGVQGAGKSHSMAVVLESCLLPFAFPAATPIVRLHTAMSALVLHCW